MQRKEGQLRQTEEKQISWNIHLVLTQKTVDMVMKKMLYIALLGTLAPRICRIYLLDLNRALCLMLILANSKINQHRNHATKKRYILRVWCIQIIWNKIILDILIYHRINVFTVGVSRFGEKRAFRRRQCHLQRG